MNEEEIKRENAPFRVGDRRLPVVGDDVLDVAKRDNVKTVLSGQ
jgi:hypothetical protein